jgi:hypothetical protein
MMGAVRRVDDTRGAAWRWYALAAVVLLALLLAEVLGVTEPLRP